MNKEKEVVIKSIKKKGFTYNRKTVIEVVIGACIILTLYSLFSLNYVAVNRKMELDMMLGKEELEEEIEEIKLELNRRERIEELLWLERRIRWLENTRHYGK